MGLNTAPDKWCCQSDKLIRGIPWAKKIVDNTLIWAEEMDQLIKRMHIILDRCRKFNITTSKRINFAGHIFSADRIKPDKERYAAISRFPRPKSVQT